MKKLYFAFTFLCLICLCQAAAAQKINSLQIIDSCNKDTTVSITVITSPANGMSLITYWGDGTFTQAPIANTTGPIYRMHHFNTAGTFSIKNVLLLNGAPIDSAMGKINRYCSYVGLGLYLDANKNCVRENTEDLISNNASYEIDSAGVIIDTVHGFEYLQCKPGTTYKARVLSVPLGVQALCPSTGVKTFTGPAAGTSEMVELGIQPGTSSAFDLSVHLMGMFRPVNNSILIISAYNNSIVGTNGIVTLHLSGKYKYKSATPPPASVNGNVLTWNLSNISILNIQRIYLYMDSAILNKPGDTVCNMAVITPTSLDVNPANNTVTQCDEVRASWDPNDKHVYPAGKIAAGTTLTYTINFENLGNDTAFNIYVLDTLPVELVEKSFKFLRSSHPVSHLFLDAPGGKRIVRFDFANIMLADKTSPEHNKGFVQFSINTRADLPPSTPIENMAAIYFDINPPVLTNYAKNTTPPTSIGKISISNDVSVYPNPVTDILTVKTENDKYNMLKLFNTMGQVVIEQPLTDKLSQINMKNLPTGIYYVLLNGENGSISQKIEKL